MQRSVTTNSNSTKHSVHTGHSWTKTYVWTVCMYLVPLVLKRLWLLHWTYILLQMLIRILYHIIPKRHHTNTLASVYLAVVPWGWHVLYPSGGNNTSLKALFLLTVFQNVRFTQEGKENEEIQCESMLFCIVKLPLISPLLNVCRQ